MNARGLNKFFWGFLFILLNFRISGFDIFPDVIGYLFFAAGFSTLAANSENFIKGGRFNIPMIFLSLFSLYNAPAQQQGQVINPGPLGLFAIPIGIVSMVLGLLTVYYLFMGIKDMAYGQEKHDIFDEAESKWKLYLYFQLAVLFAILLILLPFLALIYIIVMLAVSIAVLVEILRFMKKCEEQLQD